MSINAVSPFIEASDDGVNFKKVAGHPFQQPGAADGFV